MSKLYEDAATVIDGLDAHKGMLGENSLLNF